MPRGHRRDGGGWVATPSRQAGRPPCHRLRCQDAPATAVLQRRHFQRVPALDAFAWGHVASPHEGLHPALDRLGGWLPPKDADALVLVDGDLAVASSARCVAAILSEAGRARCR